MCCLRGVVRANDSLWISAMMFLVNVFFATNGVSLAAFSFPFSTYFFPYYLFCMADNFGTREAILDLRTVWSRYVSNFITPASTSQAFTFVSLYPLCLTLGICFAVLLVLLLVPCL